MANIVLMTPEGVRQVAVFGECRTLCIPNVCQAWARDLLGEDWVELDCANGQLMITLEDIRRIGLANATPGDRSAPGLVIRFSE